MMYKWCHKCNLQFHDYKHKVDNVEVNINTRALISPVCLAWNMVPMGVICSLNNEHTATIIYHLYHCIYRKVNKFWDFFTRDIKFTQIESK